MYSFEVLALGFITLTTAANYTKEMKECVAYLETIHDCCKSMNFKQEQKKFLTEEHVQECMLIPQIPGSCDRNLCFGIKLGFSTTDGALKMNVFEKNLKENLENQKELFEIIKKSCIDGDFQPYGEPDDCDLRKLANCIHFQVKFRCSDFSEEGSCKGSNDIAKKCLKLNSSSFLSNK